MNEETEVNEDIQPTEENGQLNQIESVSEEMGKLNFSTEAEGLQSDVAVAGEGTSDGSAENIAEEETDREEAEMGEDRNDDSDDVNENEEVPIGGGGDNILEVGEGEQIQTHRSTTLESSGQATRGAETSVQPHSNLASEEENETENEKDDGEGEYEDRGQGNKEEEEEEEDEENVPENTERSRTKRVIVQLKIALDYDDISQLTAEGFELTCCLLDTDGALEDQEQMWQSFLMTYSENVPKIASDPSINGASPSPPGVEDVVWLSVPRTRKSDTEAEAEAEVEEEKGEVEVETSPSIPIPEGYVLVGDTDFSSPDSNNSVFLAVKMGPRPNISRIRMFSALHSDIAEGTGTGAGSGLESSLDLLISASFPSVPLTDFSVRRKPVESTETGNHFHGILLQTFDENLIDSARYENPYNYESQIEKENDENEMDNEDDEAAIEARMINKIKIDSKIKEKKLVYEGGENEVENEVEMDLELSSASISSDIAAAETKKGSDSKDSVGREGGKSKEEGGEGDGEGEGEEKQEIDLEGSMDREDGDDSPRNLAPNTEDGGNRKGGSVADSFSRVDFSPMALQGGKSRSTVESEDGEAGLDDDLEAKLKALEADKLELQQINSDLQKKASKLIFREKVIQGQNALGGIGATGGLAAADDAPPLGSVSYGGATAGGDVSLIDMATEREKTFFETLQRILDSRVRLEKQQKDFDQLSLDLQMRLDAKEFTACEIAESFRAFKKEILEKAEDSRTGQKIHRSTIDAFDTAEILRESALEKVRLRNISLRTALRKLERTFRAREQLADGLHMIDFEQLKIENQTLLEKIEERNEELAKLKRKKTTTVQVLTHTREKLRFYEKSNKVSQVRLTELEEKTLCLRGEVSSCKQLRDATRDEKKELKVRQGFANNELLINDFENRKRDILCTADRIADLQSRHHSLSLLVASFPPAPVAFPAHSSSSSTLRGGSSVLGYAPPRRGIGQLKQGGGFGR